MSTEVTEDAGTEMTFEFTMYPAPSKNGENATVEMRNVILGLQPVILIEPEAKEEKEEIILKIASSEISLEDLEVILEAALTATRQALKEHNS